MKFRHPPLLEYIPWKCAYEYMTTEPQPFYWFVSMIIWSRSRALRLVITCCIHGCFSNSLVSFLKQTDAACRLVVTQSFLKRDTNKCTRLKAIIFGIFVHFQFTASKIPQSSNFLGLFACKQWISSSLKHDAARRVSNLYCFHAKSPPNRIAIWDCAINECSFSPARKPTSVSYVVHKVRDCYLLQFVKWQRS